MIFGANTFNLFAQMIGASAADFDLELLESRTLDGRTLELTHRPTLHTWPSS
jgi:hypothetical protein